VQPTHLVAFEGKTRVRTRPIAPTAPNSGPFRPVPLVRSSKRAPEAANNGLKNWAGGVAFADERP
jgi:hypothetical protein